MKTKTKVKAGGDWYNHNHAVVRRKTMKVRTKIRTGTNTQLQGKMQHESRSFQ